MDPPRAIPVARIRLRGNGGRLTTRAIADLVTQLAVTAGLTDPNGHPVATARTLRHTANHGPPP